MVNFDRYKWVSIIKFCFRCRVRYLSNLSSDKFHADKLCTVPWMRPRVKLLRDRRYKREGV